MSHDKSSSRPVASHTTVLVKLLTDNLDKVPDETLSLDQSPRLDGEGVDLYNKFIAPNSPGHSQFLTDVKILIDYYQPFFALGREPAWWWPNWVSHAWHQKKEQLRELAIRYSLASVTCEDAPLLNYCREIASTNENPLLYFYNWNFVSTCTALLNRYMCDSKLTINLLPFRNDKNTLEVKFFSLKCQFVLVKRRIIELQDELHASADYHAIQTRITGYLQDLTRQQQEIERLVQEKEVAEKSLVAKSKLSVKASSNDENEELLQLRRRCEELEGMLEQAEVDNKLLADTNRLLTAKLSLYEEDERVRKQTPELESDQPEDLQDELVKLRAELQQVKEELAKKEEELKNHSRIDSPHDSGDESYVLVFSQAASSNNALFWRSQKILQELKGLEVSLESNTKSSFVPS